MSDQPHSHAKTYTVIFILLMVLTALTVYVAKFDLGAWNDVVMLLVAVTKATLVVLFFMHVADASSLTKLYAAAGFVWLVILFGLTVSDFWSRSWIPLGQAW